MKGKFRLKFRVNPQSVFYKKHFAGIFVFYKKHFIFVYSNKKIWTGYFSDTMIT